MTENPDEIVDVLHNAPERLKENGQEKFFEVDGYKVSICAWCDADKSLTKVARVRQEEIYQRLIEDQTKMYSKKALRVVSHCACIECTLRVMKEYEASLNNNHMK